MKNFLKDAWTIIFSKGITTLYFFCSISCIFLICTVIKEFNEKKLATTEFELVAYGEVKSLAHINEVWELELETENKIVQTSVKELEDLSGTIDNIGITDEIYVLSMNNTRYISKINDKSISVKFNQKEYKKHKDDFISVMILVGFITILCVGGFLFIFVFAYSDIKKKRNQTA